MTPFEKSQLDLSRRTRRRLDAELEVNRARAFDEITAHFGQVQPKESKMGNWNMSIIGTGAHHNANNPGDADRVLSETVKKLKDAGHNVEHASITHGGRDTIVDPPASN